MTDTTFTISSFPQKFRIAKMNAIELFALKSQIDFHDYKSSLETFNLILEKIEVNVDNDNWLTVKDEDTYFPSGIEENIQAIDEIIAEFMKWFRTVFQKSNASKR